MIMHTYYLYNKQCPDRERDGQAYDSCVAFHILLMCIV